MTAASQADRSRTWVDDKDEFIWRSIATVPSLLRPSHRATRRFQLPSSSSVKPMIAVWENATAQRTSYIGVYPPCRAYGGAEVWASRPDNHRGRDTHPYTPLGAPRNQCGTEGPLPFSSLLAAQSTGVAIYTRQPLGSNRRVEQSGRREPLRRSPIATISR